MVYLTKGGFWLNANTVITNVFAFILSVFFAKFVSQETYGVYQFVLSVSSIIGAVTLTGMNTAVIQAVARGFEGVFSKSVKTQIKYSALPLILGLILSLYYALNQNSDISISLIFVAIFLPLVNALNTWGAFLSGKKEFGEYFKYNQIINLTYYVGMAVIILVIPNSIFLVAANFILNTLSNYLVYKLILAKYKPNKNYEDEALAFGKKFSFSNILPVIASNIDNIIIFHFLGAANLAIYAFASNVPDRLGGLLKPISILALPKFSQQEPEEIKKNILSKTLKFSFIASASGILYAILSPFLFKIFFPAYTESIFYSQLYTVAVVIGLVGALPFASLYARRIKQIHIFNTVYPILNIVALCIGVYFWGIFGVIFAKIFVNTIYLASSLYLNKF